MKNFLKSLKENEEKVSTLMGAALTVLVAVLFFTYFRNINKNNCGRITQEALTSEQTVATDLNKINPESLPGQYQVKAGDSLWEIAEAVYGDGFMWTGIHEANKSIIINPDNLEVGMKLNLPKTDKKIVKYTVNDGDNLWKIAENTCGTGWQWQQIAESNHVANPSVIYPGSIFTVNCGG